MDRTFAVYMLASARNGTLYIGVTSNLVRRVWEHRGKFVDGFTRIYGVERLVWYELHENVEAAIVREKQIEKWQRAWKIQRIEQQNPYWNDLYSSIC